MSESDVYGRPHAVRAYIYITANTKHFYNIYTMLDQRQRR